MTNMLAISRGLIKSVWKECAATGELCATLHVPTLNPKPSLSSGHRNSCQTSGQLLCGIGTQKASRSHIPGDATLGMWSGWLFYQSIRM